MRRMLDPKEAGGSVKQYCHFISINPEDGGEIYFNYTSTDGAKLTKETIGSALNGKPTICQGYVQVDGSPKTPEYISSLNNVVFVKWIDLTSLVGSTKDINIKYFTEKVFPVD